MIGATVLAVKIADLDCEQQPTEQRSTRGRTALPVVQANVRVYFGTLVAKAATGVTRDEDDDPPGARRPEVRARARARRTRGGYASQSLNR